MVSPRILCVDDDPAQLTLLRTFLSARGYEVAEGQTASEALQIVEAARPDAVVLDYALPDGDALQLLPRLLALDADLPIVVLTGHADIELAIAAIRAGAEHFLTKPVSLQTLEAILERAIEAGRGRRRAEADASQRQRWARDPFIGESPAIRELEREARIAVKSESPVLIQGETGTGKGVLARWLHEQGARAREPIVELNCAGLPRELLESELFGHARGAFTGAVTAKRGLVEVAHRGTLLLDELGELDLALQPKLLTLLEERRFRRLGETEMRQVDVRLVAATNRDLATAARDGNFRLDLLYRINTLTLEVPPLRARRQDVPALAEDLIGRLGADLARKVTISREAEALLTEYDFPGNIRELRNVLERAMLVARGSEIRPGDLRLNVPAADSRVAAEPAAEPVRTLREGERLQIERALRETGGSVAKAAQLLAVPRSTLYQKIREHGLAAGSRSGAG